MKSDIAHLTNEKIDELASHISTRAHQSEKSILSSRGDEPAHDALVHVIDDDLGLRKAIARLLASAKIAALFYGSVQEFLLMPNNDRVGCIVCDVRLPGMSGLVFQSQLVSLGIDLPIIIMTSFSDIPMSVKAMKAGAVDFLVKPFGSRELLDAIAVALKRDQDRRTAEGDLRELASRFNALSDREKQVLSLVVVGRLNKQIAGDLNLQEVTVKVHRGAVMRKMGANSLAVLVRMVKALGKLD